jgi:diadenosine tetraphosphate (Ap4A) HIT family hydrolase
MEETLAQAFQYDKINYLCLMMSDRHYHFHVIPRYEQPREFQGVEWTDSPRPGVPNLAVPRADDSTLVALRDHLRQYLPDADTRW